MYKWNRVIRSGNNEIRLEGESSTLRAFWEEMAFWDSLPQAGPNGEVDLKFSYRSPKGNDYYAIECPDAGQEFKFGILQVRHSESYPQQLFPKNWERAKHGQYADLEEADTAPPVQPEATTKATSDHQAALKLQAPTPKQQLIKAIDEQFKELNWKDGRHRKFLIEELCVNGAEWEHQTWYNDLLMASSEQQLQALSAKLQTYGKPDNSRPLNSNTFWGQARDIKASGHRAFDDTTIKWFIKRHTDEAGKTNWASALAALKSEAANMASGKAKAA